MGDSHHHLYEFGGFLVDAGKGVLLRDGDVVPMTPKMFDTLLALVEHNGRVMTKDQLMNIVWPDTVVEENNLTQYISALRRILSEGQNSSSYIQTLPKRGYRFVADIRECPYEEETFLAQKFTRARLVIEEIEESVSDAPAEMVGFSESPADLHPSAKASSRIVSPHFSKKKRIRRHKKRILFGLSAIIIAAASLAYVSSFESRKTINSLAILPFFNASSDPNVAYLSDGIADNLTNSLSRLPGLTVISSNAVSRYKARDPQTDGPDVQAIGREFKVQAVVVGKVMRQGDSISINVELIDARNNNHLWGEQYDRKITGILSLQEDIARKISETLKLKLTGQEESLLAKRYTENTEAYQAYLKGRYHWNKRTAEGLRKAIEFFDQAIGIDPNYALAYAGLADSYQLFSFFCGLPPSVYSPKAKAAAERALALDDNLAEAHTTLAYVRFYYDWDWAGAEAEFKRAIELNPNYATAHQWYGEFLGCMDRQDESLVERRTALAIDPLSPIITSELGYAYFYARQYDRAIGEFRKATEIFPDFSPAHGFLAWAYECSRMYDEAIAECQKSIALDNNVNVSTALPRIYAMSGRRTEAQRLLVEIQQGLKQRYSPPSHIAAVYAALNDKEQAFAWLEKAYEERDWGLSDLKVSPMFDSLRSDTRFSDLLKRMNLLP